jgi:hypothetical protein
MDGTFQRYVVTVDSAAQPLTLATDSTTQLEAVLTHRCVVMSIYSSMAR